MRKKNYTKKVVAFLLAAGILLGLEVPFASAAAVSNTLDGTEIPFSDWQNVGNGSWEQGSDGVIAPTEAQEWTMLSNNKDLGETYTIEFDVKQPDQNDSIKIGFEVNTGENFTQSGLILEMHNAGVSRIYNWGINSADESAYGGCNNGYGGGQGFSKSTDWIHVKITRANDDFTVVVNDGEERTFSFTSADYNGGCLVLGAVNGRTISYNNIVIKTTSEDEIPDGDGTVVNNNTFNGDELPFADWKNVGNGSWAQEKDGVVVPSDAQEWTMLSYDKDLGDNYTIEFDVKQPDQNDSIKIGFEVNEGENFTQSGLVLEMHNAGVSRIYNWAINSTDESAYGGCNNGYGGGQGFSKSTDWIHVKITRADNEFTVIVNDGEERRFNYTSSDYNGGHLVLGAVNGRMISYNNITIKTTVEQEKIESNNTYNGNGIPFADWTNAGNGSWKEIEGNVLTPDEIGEWMLLRYNRDLGDNFCVEFDVKQPDTKDSIMIGFAVNAGDNFTQSGLVLDLHNAGVARVFDWAINSENEAAYGGCNNGFGGKGTFNATTEWIHVKIERTGDNFLVQYNDGSGVQTLHFTAKGYEGGYLVLGSNPYRQLQYKNITITTNNSKVAPNTGDDYPIGLYASAFVISLGCIAFLMIKKRKA